MKKIITLAIAFLFLGFILSNFVEIEAARTTYNVNVTATYDSGNQLVVPLGQREYGSTVTPYTTAPEGYQFVYWIVNGFVQSTVSHPMNHEFTVTTNLELIAVFAPTTPVQKYAVVFVDSNGKQLGTTQYVLSGGTAVAPTTGLPTKPLFNLASEAVRWKTLEGSTQLTSITGHKVYTLQYVSTNLEEYTLVVHNGGGDGSYEYNEIALASASTPTNFSHWEDADGTVLSYLQDYSFTIVSDTTVTAVYSGTPLTPAPLVTLSNDLEVRSGYHTYMGRFEKPSGYEVLEYGFLFSDDAEILTFDTVGVTIAKSNSYNSVTNEFVTSFAIGSHMSMRAYVVVKNEETITNVYSEVNHRYIDDEFAMTGKNLDFETTTDWGFWSPSGTGVSYSSTVSLDTQSLKMSEGSAWLGFGFDGPSYPAKGDDIKLGFWIYVDSTTATSVGGFTIKIIEKDGATPDAVVVTYTTSHQEFLMDEWVYIETQTVTIGNNPGYLQIVILEGTDGTVYVDDITLIKVPE